MGRELGFALIFFLFGKRDLGHALGLGITDKKLGMGLGLGFCKIWAWKWGFISPLLSSFRILFHNYDNTPSHKHYLKLEYLFWNGTSVNLLGESGYSTILAIVLFWSMGRKESHAAITGNWHFLTFVMQVGKLLIKPPREMNSRDCSQMTTYSKSTTG